MFKYNSLYNIGISTLKKIQMLRALQAWEAKLIKFRERYGGNPNALRTNPVWNKLMKIRNSLAHLVASEEMEFALSQSRFKYFLLKI